MRDDEKVNIDMKDVTKREIIVPYGVEKQRKIICEVCGHANPEYTAICKNCSNYLEGR